MEKWYLSCGKHIGRQHVSAKVPCQDDCLTMERNGVSVIALSDGCSSAFLAERGSYLTVNAICQLFTLKFDYLYKLSDDEIKKEAIEILEKTFNHDAITHKNLIEKYKKEQPDSYNAEWDDVKEYPNAENLFNCGLYNATVLFVAVKDNKAIVGRIGDGFIIQIEDKTLKLLSIETKEGAVNVTDYPSCVLTHKAFNDPYAYEVFSLFKLEDLSKTSAFILGSDGVETTIERNIKNGTAVDTFVSKNNAKHIVLNMLNIEDLLTYYAERSFDDVSLAIMRRQEVSFNKIGVRRLDEVNDFFDDNLSFDIEEPSISNVFNENNFDVELLSKQEINSLSKYFNDEKKLEKIIDAINDIKTLLAAKEKVTYKEALAYMKHINNAELLMINKYIEKLHLVKLDKESRCYVRK